MRLMLEGMRSEIIQLGHAQTELVKRLDALASWPIAFANLSEALLGTLETLAQSEKHQSEKLDNVFEQLTQQNIGLTVLIGSL
jgi:hypothetical protein